MIAARSHSFAVSRRSMPLSFAVVLLMVAGMTIVLRLVAPNSTTGLVEREPPTRSVRVLRSRRTGLPSRHVIARVDTVEHPVAPNGREPPPLLVRPDREPRDRPLPALEIAVEDVDRHRRAGLDRPARIAVLRGCGIAERPLPKADIARRDVEVARQPRERIQRRVVFRPGVLGLEVPAVEDRQAGASVADGDDEIDGLVVRLGDRAAAGNFEPPLAQEDDLLGPVIHPRRIK